VNPRRYDEQDFIDRFAEVSFYDRSNPVREWMEYGRSNLPPVLDEDSDEMDVPLPSHLVRYIIFIYIQMCVYVSPVLCDSFVCVGSDQIDPDDLRQATGHDCISDWARRNVGATHLGKRKMQMVPPKGHDKRHRGKGKAVTSDTETEDEQYQSQDSGDDDSGDDDSANDGASGSDGGGAGGTDGGGGGSGDATIGAGGSSYVGLHFTGIHCTYIHTIVSVYAY
jgi:uncharacterized membrane protein YgcG